MQKRTYTCCSRIGSRWLSKMRNHSPAHNCNSYLLKVCVNVVTKCYVISLWHCHRKQLNAVIVDAFIQNWILDVNRFCTTLHCPELHILVPFSISFGVGYALSYRRVCRGSWMVRSVLTGEFRQAVWCMWYPNNSLPRGKRSPSLPHVKLNEIFSTRYIRPIHNGSMSEKGVSSAVRTINTALLC